MNTVTVTYGHDIIHNSIIMYALEINCVHYMLITDWIRVTLLVFNATVNSNKSYIMVVTSIGGENRGNHRHKLMSNYI